jgi:hypothetical protein
LGDIYEYKKEETKALIAVVKAQVYSRILAAGRPSLSGLKRRVII